MLASTPDLAFILGQTDYCLCDVQALYARIFYRSSHQFFSYTPISVCRHFTAALNTTVPSCICHRKHPWYHRTIAFPQNTDECARIHLVQNLPVKEQHASPADALAITCDHLLPLRSP
jgi:hypothetical protein